MYLNTNFPLKGLLLFSYIYKDILPWCTPKDLAAELIEV